MPRAPRPLLLLLAVIGIAVAGAALFVQRRPPTPPLPSLPDEPAAATPTSPATSPAPTVPAEIARHRYEEPPQVGVQTTVRGRVQGASDLAAVRVWLLAFDDAPDHYMPGQSSPSQQLHRLVDEHAFDLAAIAGKLFGIGELVATAAPASDGTFAIAVAHALAPDRARLIAFDPAASECTALVPPSPAGTTLEFAARRDLDVVVTHDLGDAELTVEAVDDSRPGRPAQSIPLQNGIAHLPNLPRRHWVLCVRCSEPPLYCATGPIDTSAFAFAIHLAIRTRSAPCTAELHAEEQNGTIAPILATTRSSGRMPGTPPLRLCNRCPRCALLAAGTYDFSRQKPKYAFGSFPMPRRVAGEPGIAHYWDEDGVHEMPVRAWIEVR